MSSLTPKQIFAAQKAGVEMTFAVLSEAMDGLGKLVELNVQAVKSMLAENQEGVTPTKKIHVMPLMPMSNSQKPIQLRRADQRSLAGRGGMISALVLPSSL